MRPATGWPNWACRKTLSPIPPPWRDRRAGPTLVEAAEPYYASARWGMRDLPVRSAWAIGAARGVYRQIGLDVVKAGDAAWDERVVVSGRMKAWRALEGGVLALRSATLDRWGPAPERPAMWSRI